MRAPSHRSPRSRPPAPSGAANQGHGLDPLSTLAPSRGREGHGVDSSSTVCLSVRVGPGLRVGCRPGHGRAACATHCPPSPRRVQSAPRAWYRDETIPCELWRHGLGLFLMPDESLVRRDGPGGAKSPASRAGGSGSAAPRRSSPSRPSSSRGSPTRSRAGVPGGLAAGAGPRRIRRGVVQLVRQGRRARAGGSARPLTRTTRAEAPDRPARLAREPPPARDSADCLTREARPGPRTRRVLRMLASSRP